MDDQSQEEVTAALEAEELEDEATLGDAGKGKDDDGVIGQNIGF